MRFFKKMSDRSVWDTAKDKTTIDEDEKMLKCLLILNVATILKTSFSSFPGTVSLGQYVELKFCSTLMRSEIKKGSNCSNIAGCPGTVSSSGEQ